MYKGRKIPAYEVVKDSVTLDARLLRRLHVLLDHGAPGAHHPVAVARIGARRAAPDGPATRRSRAWSPTWAGRRPTCTR